MFGIISNYKHLYVADFSKCGKNEYKIIHSGVNNLVVDGSVINPFADEVRTGVSVLIDGSKHIKRLSYYVNCFGLPRRKIALGDKDRQSLIVSEVKTLKKLRKI